MLAGHALLVGLLVGTTALSTALAIVNVRYGAREVTANEGWLREELGVDDPDELLGYQRARTGTSLLQTWTLLGLLLLALYAGVVTAAVEWLGATGLHPVVQGVAFFLGLIVVHRVASAPFDAYETFVVEEQFEFNEQSPRLWVRDTLVGLAVTVAVLAPLLAVLLWLIDRFPVAWWAVGGWALVVGFGLLMQVLYPRVIAPLFNDFEPVEAGELREAVEAVFERAGFEASGIYTMDASRRSSHLNAYFVGFGRTKRVVLFDTLVDALSLEELEAVLAHELAHWKFHHVWKRVGATAVQMAVVFGILGSLVTAEWVYDLFALPADAAYAGLFVAMLVVYPLLELTAPLTNRLSLAHEREADDFAVDVTGGESMAGALATLASENLANPFPHPWYAAFTQSHPPIPERIRRVRERAGDGGDGGTGDGTAGVEPTADD